MQLIVEGVDGFQQRNFAQQTEIGNKRNYI